FFIYVVIRRRLLLAAQEAHETIGQQDQRQRNKDRHQRQHQETPLVQIAILDALTWPRRLRRLLDSRSSAGADKLPEPFRETIKERGEYALQQKDCPVERIV